MLNAGRSLSIVALAITSCAQAPVRGSRVGDMSANQHRAESEQHEGRSTAGQLHDRQSTQTRPWSDDPSSSGFARIDDVWRLSLAQESWKHTNHARQHLSAAQALEAFKDMACMPVPASERAKCPFADRTLQLRLVPNGVELLPENSDELPTLLEHLRCHHAFGNVHGHQSMPECPLYLESLAIKQQSSGIRLTSNKTSVATELQRRMRHLAEKHGSPSGGKP